MIAKSYTCIVCPQSCKVSVEEVESALYITGATCKRGEEFARNEHTNPKRMLTSTVKVKNGVLPRLPVVTAQEIPKSMLYQCLNIVYKTTVTAPVTCGDVIVKDIGDTGVDLVASRNIASK